jgi:mono/diheme cytochrome c family protein
MAHLSKVLVGTAALAALALPPAVAGQAPSDPQVAAGMALWKKHGCVGCHAIGKKLAGPDLAGVEERRSKDWIYKWMKDTKGMLDSDTLAKRLMKESNGARMPQFKVSDSDIDQLLAYIKWETARKKAAT